MIDALKEEEIVNKVGGRFKLSTLIQKRLAAINAGARALVDFQSEDKMEVVVQEILQDKIYLDSSGKNVMSSRSAWVRVMQRVFSSSDAQIPARPGVRDPSIKLRQCAHSGAPLSNFVASWVTAQNRSQGIVLPALNATCSMRSRPWLLIG